MTWTLDGRPLRRILVTRLRYLGDVVMATSVLEALRAGDPQIELGFLCEEAFAPVLAGHPLLQRIHALRVTRRGRDARARTHAAGGVGAARGALATALDLRAARYDLAVDLFFNPRSAWLLRLGGVRARIGGARGSRRRLYTHTVLADEVRASAPEAFAAARGGLGDHLARLAPLRQDDGLPFTDWLAARAGSLRTAPRLEAGAYDHAGAQAALAEVGLPPSGGAVLLAPGATWRSKEWPLTSWRELIRVLADGTDLPLTLLLPPGREAAWRDLAEAVPEGRGGALPPLELPAALAVIARAAAVVSVDGGIMHAAVGLGRPTVGLFGPTDPEIWFPYREHGPFRVLARRPACHPCDRHDCDEFVCLPELAPEHVFAALREVLAQAAGGSASG